MEKLAVVLTDKYREDCDDAKIINSIKACIKFNGFTYFDINFNFRLNDFENKKESYLNFINFMIRSQAKSADMICCDFARTPSTLKNIGMCFDHLSGKTTFIKTSLSDEEFANGMLHLDDIYNSRLETEELRKLMESENISQEIKKDSSIEDVIVAIFIGINKCAKQHYELTVSKSNKYYDMILGARLGEFKCENLIEVE